MKNTNTENTKTIKSIKSIKKLNGSFIIKINNLPYNTTPGDKYYNDTLKLFESNPELFETEEEKIIEYNLEELKQQKIREIKFRANIIIESEEHYPMYKQSNVQREYLLNILNSEDVKLENEELKNKSEEKFNTMNNFINNIRSQSNQMEKNVSQLENWENIINFEIDYKMEERIEKDSDENN